MSHSHHKNKKKLDISHVSPKPTNHKLVARRLLKWYDHNRRDLPWRVGKNSRSLPDPYWVLVSEFMLQQTQVATVIPYFHRFLARFPTISDLARADEQDVLRQWQGLGYYSRARNLQAAAKKIVSDFSGKIPSTVAELFSLPGVGRYTAGAIASIAFSVAAPIVDGNVTRLLCRLEKIAADPRDPAVVKRLWAKAQEMLPDDRVGDFNSAMMELGATVCTPRSPSCPQCPLREFCRANAAGVQELIPPPRRAPPTDLFHRWTLCLSRNDRWLIEQRPSRGRWAGLWQFITLEAPKRRPTAANLHKHFCLPVSDVKPLGQIRHALTHRRYQFDVFVGRAADTAKWNKREPRQWVKLEQLDAFPLSRPQVRIAQMLQSLKKS